MRHYLTLCTLLFLASAGSAGALTITWDGHADGRLREYMVVTSLSLTWDGAAGDLASRYGADWHLATITSQAEQGFLVANLLSAGLNGEYWLGGAQSNAYAGSVTADQGWSWVTGEAWDFTAWAAGEPNEWGGHRENGLGIWSSVDWLWNDEHGNTNIVGYVAERPYLVNPEPGTMLLLGSGLVGLSSGLRRRTRRDL